jgi:hypothetical protein
VTKYFSYSVLLTQISIILPDPDAPPALDPGIGYCPRGSVAEPEPEPQGAATFAGAGAVTLIQFLAPAPAPAPCYKLGILK